MSEVRKALIEKGVTGYEEQNKHIWIMAKALMDRMGELFEALDEPAPTEGTDGGD